MNARWLLLLTVFSFSCAMAQQRSLVSGPWAGNIEMRTASVWAEPAPGSKKAELVYYPLSDSTITRTVQTTDPVGPEFSPVKFHLTGLEMNTTYGYYIRIDGKRIHTAFPTRFTTKDLWQYRKPAPDISFLAGSCAYFNEPRFDRPGQPYGSDSSIFTSMSREKADFHVWMGDNWYTREVDYSSAWGLHYRASRDRSLAVLQPFMASMPQYATWDDHDFGPNNSGKYYQLKKDSREVFKKYTLHPAYGELDAGVYYSFSWSDVDFFMTDSRYFRSHDDLADSINGKPNAEKTFFGSTQLDWLKNSLLQSRATFKVIVVGSQVLNPVSRYDCLRQYPYEYEELMAFLNSHRVNGVIFFSGDRHHSEVIRLPRENNYPLYDVTISPYTSGVGLTRGEEKDNPFRVPGTLVEAHNYGRISVAGPKGKRTLKLAFVGLKGEQLGEWSVAEQELKKPSR